MHVSWIIFRLSPSLSSWFPSNQCEHYHIEFTLPIRNRHKKRYFPMRIEFCSFRIFQHIPCCYHHWINQSRESVSFGEKKIVIPSSINIKYRYACWDISCTQFYIVSKIILKSEIQTFRRECGTHPRASDFLFFFSWFFMEIGS